MKYVHVAHVNYKARHRTHCVVKGLVKSINESTMVTAFRNVVTGRGGDMNYARYLHCSIVIKGKN